MEHSETAQAAAAIGALGAALVLVPRARGGLLLGLLLLCAAESGLAFALIPGSDLRGVVETPGRIALLACGALVLLALGAALARHPGLAPPLLLLAAPFRVPIELGAQKAFLLLPLYAVLGAAVLGLVVRAIREGPLPALPRVLALPATVFLALAAVSSFWSRDLRAGTVQLLFFLFPFAVLVAVIGRAPVRPWLPRALAATLVALASAFAIIGLWQRWSRDLFFAPDLEVANAYTSFFRVTSVFKDPSLYGRHLVLAMAIVLVALWVRRLHLVLALPALGLLWAGLYFSYSQSSMVTLLAVTLLVTLVAADRRSRQVVAVTAVAVVVAGAAVVGTTAKGESLKRFTSGRSSLAVSSAKVFERHPVVGVGVGGQPRASREEAQVGKVTRRNVSHMTPLTVAAELGVVGLAAYVALLAGAARLLASLHRREATLGLGLAAVFLALVVHSLFYSGFFEDPLTWGALAVAGAFLAAEGRTALVSAPAAPEPSTPRPSPTVAAEGGAPGG